MKVHDAGTDRILRLTASNMHIEHPREIVSVHSSVPPEAVLLGSHISSLSVRLSFPMASPTEVPSILLYLRFRPDLPLVPVSSFPH